MSFHRLAIVLVGPDDSQANHTWARAEHEEELPEGLADLVHAHQEGISTVLTVAEKTVLEAYDRDKRFADVKVTEAELNLLLVLNHQGTVDAWKVFFRLQPLMRTIEAATRDSPNRMAILGEGPTQDRTSTTDDSWSFYCLGRMVAQFSSSTGKAWLPEADFERTYWACNEIARDSSARDVLDAAWQMACKLASVGIPSVLVVTDRLDPDCLRLSPWADIRQVSPWVDPETPNLSASQGNSGIYQWSPPHDLDEPRLPDMAWWTKAAVALVSRDGTMRGKRMVKTPTGPNLVILGTKVLEDGEAIRRAMTVLQEAEDAGDPQAIAFVSSDYGQTLWMTSEKTEIFPDVPSS